MKHPNKGIARDVLFRYAPYSKVWGRATAEPKCLIERCPFVGGSFLSRKYLHLHSKEKSQLKEKRTGLGRDGAECDCHAVRHSKKGPHSSQDRLQQLRHNCLLCMPLNDDSQLQFYIRMYRARGLLMSMDEMPNLCMYIFSTCLANCFYACTACEGKTQCELLEIYYTHFHTCVHTTYT